MGFFVNVGKMLEKIFFFFFFLYFNAGCNPIDFSKMSEIVKHLKMLKCQFPKYFGKGKDRGLLVCYM